MLGLYKKQKTEDNLKIWLHLLNATQAKKKY